MGLQDSVQQENGSDDFMILLSEIGISDSNNITLDEFLLIYAKATEKKEDIIVPVQSQVLAEVLNESAQQRGTGSITMAAVPKAYWITLFNLDTIKNNNKPTAPLTKPPQLPFFMPTVVNGGSTPSFPTPAEYQKIISGSNDQVSNKRTLEASTEASISIKKTISTLPDDSEMLGLKAVWSDDDESSFPLGEDNGIEQFATKTQQASKKYESRILKGKGKSKSELPRYAI